MRRSRLLGRMGLGLGVLAVTSALARTRDVDVTEQQLFRTVNDLPHALHPPVYVVMQSGSLAAVFAGAGVAGLRHRRRLAGAVLVAGTATWGAAKVVKRWVGRHRPAGHLDGVTIHGAEESGLGFPSGHAAVACCLAALVSPHLPPAARPFAWTVAGTVGVSRVYVGAHLPLDIVGGAALGVVTGTAGRLVGTDAARP